MRIFVTGAAGYIGGSVATALAKAGHTVSGLVRSEERANQVREFGIQPILGSLSDKETLTSAARGADAVISAASSDDRISVETLIAALAGSNKPLLHTSGSSIVGDMAAGTRSNNIYEDDTPFEPSPGKVARVAIDRLVRASAKNGVRSAVICPTLIYGRGHGVHKDSIQVPKLIALAKQHGVGKHVGPGENIWSNVHIDDLVTLYLLALEKAPAGAFYFAENGENAWREVAAAISRLLGYGGKTESIPIEQAVTELGEVTAHMTFGSNSRVRAVRARKELGWKPNGRPLLDDIEHGSYVQK